MLSRMLHLEKVMKEHRSVDAKQLRKIAETGNHLFFLFCLFYTVVHTSSGFVVLCACARALEQSSARVCVYVFINGVYS